LPAPHVDAVSVSDGRLRISLSGEERTLLATWLRGRSREPDHVDATNFQRLDEPADIAPDLSVIDAIALGNSGVTVALSDGSHCTFTATQLANWTGIEPEADAVPGPESWSSSDFELPRIAWSSVTGDDDALRRVLRDFHRFGCFVITGAPTAEGSLHSIAGRFGRVSATNFGALFDVRSTIEPADLAYTPVGLSAHTDQPYRRPTPGLQFLHALVNDADGGDSTVVDGLAAVEECRVERPDDFAVLSSLVVEWRYDMGSDVVVGHAPIIELALDGSLRQIRFSPRLDFPPAVDAEVLDAWFGARRRLFERLNDPRCQVEFKLAAGDVIVVDNHRVLHGRRPFDLSAGHRHLQGCYIDHDGPSTMLRLLTRRRGPTDTDMFPLDPVRGKQDAP
jgi:gamma-butyrobetaine dioxygenase